MRAFDRTQNSLWMNNMPIEMRSLVDGTEYRYSRQTWSDGCLGLGGPAESCLAALTEGWQVVLVDLVTGDRYTYRTNEEGSAVRLYENVNSPTLN